MGRLKKRTIINRQIAANREAKRRAQKVEAAAAVDSEEYEKSAAHERVHHGQMIPMEDDASSSNPSGSVPSRSLSPQTLFNQMFEYNPSKQKRGADNLPSLKGRAGTGDSKRNKRRKVAERNSRGEEASKSQSMIRQFERGGLKDADLPMPAIENEKCAVSTPSDIEAAKI
ncbi:hypothetical protein RUND412_003070 [Rhizina undulata]